MKIVFVKMCRLNLLLAILFVPMAISCQGSSKGQAQQPETKLPPPSLKSDYSVEQALQSRRSVRTYSPGALSLEELGQLLWAAQGITEPTRKLRSAPSAGATYPLILYAIVDQVETLAAGFYRYLPETHSLKLVKSGNIKAEVTARATRQGSVAQAPVILVFAADLDRIRPRYRERSERYTFMEIGHAAQNVHLQCEALGLGTVCIGAFEESTLKQALELPDEQIPFYLMPVGKKN